MRKCVNVQKYEKVYKIMKKVCESVEKFRKMWKKLENENKNI